jgi:hypothetical protein
MFRSHFSHLHYAFLVVFCLLHDHSATFNDEVKRLITLSLKQPVRLAADAAAATPKDLRQEIVRLKVRVW